MIGSSPLAREFWERGKSESCPIYDMHGHMGTSLYPDFIPTAALQKDFLAYILHICGATKYFLRLACIVFL